ncbi:hypothetical protein PIB30_110824 [Stylosanthes scabra]|uniref:Uncharacterized protein n=1 Tax=Stylosanthes scabra TaxID=79078 RepID=A0ABU6V0D0_9FABA|nr:hypothetical protein [Stylosanthes scabra]
MYALALKGKNISEALNSPLTIVYTQTIAWSFNPRGIDTPLHCGILLDMIRYTCRDLGLRNPSIKDEASIIGPELIQETTEQIKRIRSRILTAQSRQKS